jgi:hypothetical protein
MGFLCSCRHGGELAEETSFSACVWVGVWASSSVLSPLLHDGAHHMANKLVAMICGLDDGHFSRCFASASTTSLLEALKKIPTGATHLPAAKWFRPRQQVAGGRHRSLIAGGEDSGLDRVSVFFLGSFLLFARTCFPFVFLQGPLCKMYPSLGN